MVRVQYPGNPPQSHRWAINPAALRIVAGLNLGDTVRIAIADMQAVFDVWQYYVHNIFKILLSDGDHGENDDDDNDDHAGEDLH